MTTPLAAAATCAGLLLFTADPSFAQAGSLPPDTLSRLRAHDKVTVETTAGRVEGRLLEMAADGLLVATEAGPRRVDATEIDRIDRRRKGVVLGTLIGLGAGVAVAVPVASWFNNEGSDDTTAAVLMLAGVGAAAVSPRPAVTSDYGAILGATFTGALWLISVPVVVT